MKLILVCQTDAAEPWLYPTDRTPAQPATDAGRRDAARLGRDLIDRFQLTAVYTSPARAALETANVVADAGVVPIVSDDLLPPEGAGFEFLRPADGATTPLNGGERLEEVQERAWRFVQRVRDETDAAQTAAVISHPIVIRAVVSRLLGLGRADWRRFAIAPGSITTIDFRPTRTILAGLNETCHLEGTA